jgi:hypothetical protein
MKKRKKKLSSAWNRTRVVQPVSRHYTHGVIPPLRPPQSQSQSYSTTGGLPPISSSWRTNPLTLTTNNFFRLNVCGHSSYVRTSLTRGWVCRLQLLLTLASAVILRSESRHFTVSDSRLPQNLEGQVPVFITPRNTVAPLYPRHRVLFSSPPLTCRGTVEVFETASTRATHPPHTSPFSFNFSSLSFRVRLLNDGISN